MATEIASESETEIQQVRSVKRQTDFVDPVVGATSEVLFVVLPLLVVAIVTIIQSGGVKDLLVSSEWSFAAAVLFGHSAIKLITIAASGGGAERVGLFGAVIIVFGLVPSLITLALLLTGKSNIALIVMQLILCVTGVVSYVVFGALSHYSYVRSARVRRLLSRVGGAFEKPGA